MRQVLYAHPVSVINKIILLLDGKQKKDLYFGAVCLVLTQLLEKSAPWILGDAVDAIVNSKSHGTSRVWIHIATLAWIAVGVYFIRTTSRVKLFNIGRDVEYELRNRILQKVHKLPQDTTAVQFKTGEVMSRATNDLTQVRLLVGFGILNTVNSFLALFLSLGLMGWISLLLTGWAVLPFMLVFVIAYWFSKMTFKWSSKAQRAMGEMSQRVQESVGGVRTIRSAGGFKREQKIFESLNHEVFEANLTLSLLRVLLWPTFSAMALAATVIVIMKGGDMVIAGTMSLGNITAFLGYLGQLLWPTLAMGWIMSIVQRGKASWIRIEAILDAEEERAPEHAITPHLSASPEIRFEHVDYAVDHKTILSDINMHIHSGSLVAIVGQVGSGKSALLDALGGLVPDTHLKGDIWLGSTPMSQIKKTELRKAVGYAQQNPFLFSTTIALNLSFGEASITEAHMWRALEQASLAEEVRKFPDGLDTMVGERGIQLSGGQRQRLALARALLSEPKVLLLDDPFSAVDAETEHKIIDGLEGLKQGRTTVLVTNRIAAAKKADHIMVMVQGCIQEEGTHETLMKRGGLYARLSHLQDMERAIDAA